MSNWLFLHGGPGFNSYAEESLLKPELDKRLASGSGGHLYLWNEPSAMRSDGPVFTQKAAYKNLCLSVEDKVKQLKDKYGKLGVVAHSFSIFPILSLLETSFDEDDIFVFVSPVLDLEGAHRRILNLVMHDFKEKEEDKKIEIENLLSQSKKLFDEPIQKAMIIASGDEQLFLNYWQDHSMLQKFDAILKEKQASLDVDSFFAVLKDLSETPFQPPNNLPNSALVVFGEQDPVVSPKIEKAIIQKVFPNSQFSTLPSCGHWPHIEKMDQFINEITKFAHS